MKSWNYGILSHNCPPKKYEMDIIKVIIVSLKSRNYDKNKSWNCHCRNYETS